MNYKIGTILFILIIFFLSGCTTKIYDSRENKNNSSNEGQIIKKEEQPATEKDENVDLYWGKFNVTNDKDTGSKHFFTGNTENKSHIIRFKKFNGIHTMLKISMKKDEIKEFNYTSTLESGKLNILIQDEKYNILKQIDTNSEESITLQAPETGTYTIRAVGDEALKGEVIITFK